MGQQADSTESQMECEQTGLSGLLLLLSGCYLVLSACSEDEGQ